MNKNLYIEALKFGATRMQSGVSLKEIINHLKECKGINLEDSFLEYFRIWFFENFYEELVNQKLYAGESGWRARIRTELNNADYDSKPCVMMATGYEMLLDYEKLQQARQ